MMTELAQAGIFFSGSAGSKDAPRTQAAPGLRAEETARSGEKGFSAIFREARQRRGEGRNSPGRIRSHEPGEEEAVEAQAALKEGDAAGILDSPWFLLLDSLSGEAALDGSEPVDSSRAGDGGQEPASPLQGGPVTVEAGLTGGNFPELAEVKAEGEVPVETGPQGEPAAAKIFRMTAEAAMETGTVQEETGRPVEVSGTTPVTEEQLPDGAGLTWEAVKEESQAPGIVQVLTGNGEAGTGNPAGPEKPVSGTMVPGQPAPVEAKPVEAETPPVAGRWERESDPHLPAGEKSDPAFSAEQLKVESEEERPVFSVPGKEKTAGPSWKKEESEVLTAARLEADPVRADAPQVVDEPGQGERSPVAEKVMNQILQGAKLMVKNGVAHMHMELQPPALGKLQLALVVEGELVTARFTAESQTVQALIESNLPELRSALQEAGLQVDQLQVDVETGAGSQGGSFGQLMPEKFSSGSGSPKLESLETAFFSEDEGVEGIREEAAWLGRVNLRV